MAKKNSKKTTRVSKAKTEKPVATERRSVKADLLNATAQLTAGKITQAEYVSLCMQAANRVPATKETHQPGEIYQDAKGRWVCANQRKDDDGNLVFTDKGAPKMTRPILLGDADSIRENLAVYAAAAKVIDKAG